MISACRFHLLSVCFSVTSFLSVKCTQLLVSQSVVVVVWLPSHVWFFATPWTAQWWASLSPRVCSDACPLSRCCHPTISSSVVPFSFRLQSFPASGSFPVSWLFASGGQTVGASASVWVLPVNIQGWFLVGLTGLIFMQSKGLRFTSLTPKMLMFTLTISCLTMSNSPWFMDLTVQVPIQCCSLQHRSLLSPPDSSTTVPRFCFGESMKNYKFISIYCFNWISKYGDLLSLL